MLTGSKAGFQPLSPACANIGCLYPSENREFRELGAGSQVCISKSDSCQTANYGLATRHQIGSMLVIEAAHLEMDRGHGAEVDQPVVIDARQGGDRHGWQTFC